jgi:dTMP kinase
LSNDVYESYRIFQSRVIEQYESMIEEEGFTVIDGTQDIEKQQANVRERMLEQIPKKQQLLAGLVQI